jgi:hypothetical protein
MNVHTAEQVIRIVTVEAVDRPAAVAVVLRNAKASGLVIQPPRYIKAVSKSA